MELRRLFSAATCYDNERAVAAAAAAANDDEQYNTGVARRVFCQTCCTGSPLSVSACAAWNAAR